jgi:catechol 2,3-dioxygenase-like lactoylglutathione lyase family enzyme
MRPFVSLITLGVADVERSRRFYEALGWRAAREQDDWVCFELGDGSSAFALWPRDKLAGDAAAVDPGGEFGGVTSRTTCRRASAWTSCSLAGRGRGRSSRQAGVERVLGRLQRLLRRSRRLPMEVTNAGMYRAE